MKKMFLGILIGVAVSVPATIFADEIASVVGKKVDGEFAVTLNNNKLDVPAIVIEGTSYAPVRVIGETLGLDVKFDANTGISLNAKEVKPVSESPVLPDPVVEELPKDVKINILQNNILEKKNLLLSWHGSLKMEEKTPSGRDIVKLKEDIAMYEAELAALEAELAELQK